MALPFLLKGQRGFVIMNKTRVLGTTPPPVGQISGVMNVVGQVVHQTP